MDKFTKEIAVKEWNEYGPGICYYTTVGEFLEMLKTKDISNAKINRDPTATPWPRGSHYTYFRNLIVAKTRIKKIHPNFVGQAKGMSVFVDANGDVYIIDGGHRALYLGNLNDPDYVFPPLGVGEVEDCEYIEDWCGRTVKDVKSLYPTEWQAFMDSVILISTVDDDGLIQQGNNSGRMMSKTEMAYAMVKNHKTYIALETAVMSSTAASPLATLNIGGNKGNNPRVRVNNMCWAVSVLAQHKFEKSGEAMRYMVEHYDAAFILDAYQRLLEYINPSDFNMIGEEKKTGFVYNCNAIHGIMEYARIKTLPRSSAKKDKLLNDIGDNNTNNPVELDVRKACANRTLQYLDEHYASIATKVAKVKKKYGDSYVSSAGAGHKGAGNTLSKYMMGVK